MNRIVAEHKIIRMLDGRAQDETCVFEGFEFEGSIRLFKNRQLAVIHDLGRSQLSFMHGDPGNGVIVRRRGEAEAALSLLTRESNRGVLLPLDELKPARLQSPPASDGCLGIAADRAKVTQPSAASAA
jgi:hypothetical protein